MTLRRLHTTTGATWVLLLSGILGFRMGMIGFPEWQVAVETAQVVAGIVTYPPDNIFYIYHTRLWTVLHQVLALALRAGVGEITLSLVVSGLQGMLTFQALALFVYALSRDVLLAVGAAALIFFTRAAEYGTIYPIYLLGSPHTYGVIGLSTGVLAMALLGAGRYRTGALLLGIAPCVHPAIGSWTNLAVGLAVLSDVRTLRLQLRPALPWFLAGCGVTLASFLVQYSLAPALPEGMARLSPDDLSAFVRLWDSHRASVDITSTGVQLNAASFVIASVWLVMVRLSAAARPNRASSGETRRSLGEGGKPATTDGMPAASQLLLRITAASSLLALAMIPLSWIPPERLPLALLVLMPGRYLNFAALTFVALLLGLLGSRRELWSRLVLLFLSIGVLLTNRSMIWEFLRHHHGVQFQIDITQLPIVWLSALAVLAGGVWSQWRFSPPTHPAHPTHLTHPAHLVLLVVLGLTVIMTTHMRAEQSGAHFADRTNDVFFSEVAAQPGVLLLAGDLYLIQLRTRRPVLLDAGALDTMMYSLETGAAMQRMLRDIYGLDLRKPPPEAIGAGRIPPGAHQRTWERYSGAKWRQIRRDFGVTQVLTYAEWRLRLPPVSQSRRMLLYDIPER